MELPESLLIAAALDQRDAEAAADAADAIPEQPIDRKAVHRDNICEAPSAVSQHYLAVRESLQQLVELHKFESVEDAILALQPESLSPAVTAIGVSLRGIRLCLFIHLEGFRSIDLTYEEVIRTIVGMIGCDSDSFLPPQEE